MTASLTQYAEHGPLYGETVSKCLPVFFNGVIGNFSIDGEESVAGRNKHAHCFRLSNVVLSYGATHK